MVTDVERLIGVIVGASDLKMISAHTTGIIVIRDRSVGYARWSSEGRIVEAHERRGKENEG
jgi:hypothetical protein